MHIERSLLVIHQGYYLTTTKEDNIRDIDVAPEYMQFMRGYYQQRNRNEKRRMELCPCVKFWWAIQDLNPGPSGYEPPALTN